MPRTFRFQPTLEHYRRALGFAGGRFVESSQGGILPSIWNSVVIATVTTALSLLVAVPAGYACARLRFRGQRLVAFYALFTQMAPPIGLLIPYFCFLNRALLMDSYPGLIGVYLTFSVPFGI